jgi:hypothetical protein
VPGRHSHDRCGQGDGLNEPRPTVDRRRCLLAAFSSGWIRGLLAPVGWVRRGRRAAAPAAGPVARRRRALDHLKMSTRMRGGHTACRRAATMTTGRRRERVGSRDASSAPRRRGVLAYQGSGHRWRLGSMPLIESTNTEGCERSWSGQRSTSTSESFRVGASVRHRREEPHHLMSRMAWGSARSHADIGTLPGHVSRGSRVPS